VRTACAVKYFSRQGTPAAAAITAAVKHTRAHSHGGLYRNGRRCNRRTFAECQRKAHESARVGLWRPRQSATNSKYSQSATTLQLSLYIHVLIPTSAPAHLRPHQPPHVLFARAIGPHLYVHVWKDTWPTTCGTQAVDRQTAGSDATKTLTQRSPVIWRKN